MRTVCLGGDRVARPGEVVTVDDDLGADLIASNKAALADPRDLARLVERKVSGFFDATKKTPADP